MIQYARIIPMLLCMGMIFCLSHQPHESLAVSLFPGDDKLAHMVAYAMLGGTVIYAFPPRRRSGRRVLVFTAAIVIPVLYGISDEYHQRFVAGRNAEFPDVAADAAGALAVSVVWLVKTSGKQAHKTDI